MAIPRECKRLAEVDFPIAVVSKHAVREKSIRQGHPSTLHLWWARRPLASSRAMLLALLLPDPCDERCPGKFKAKAREALAPLQRVGTSDEDLRRALLKFIGDFANWDAARNQRYIDAGRRLVHAAYPGDPPLVVDPFAGGGSIPLEALRLGCDAFGSDLNPVACLILKILLEDVPRHGPELAEDLTRAGTEIVKAAQDELAEVYPAGQDGSQTIAYIWARTIRCETPGCGAEIPLVASFWLSKKPNRKRAMRYRIDRTSSQTPQLELEIFEPTADSDVPSRTVSRAKATCPACRIVLGPERVRAQLREQRGGADVIFGEDGLRVGGARMLAVVSLLQGKPGRQYRLAESNDYAVVRNAIRRLGEAASATLPGSLSAVPDEPTPAGGGSGAGRAFSIQNYGMMTFADLFTARQKLALTTLARRIRDLHCSPAVQELLAVALDRVASRSSSLCVWRHQADQEKVEHIFGRQALPVVWDFAESVATSDSTGSFADGVEVVADCVSAAVKLFDSAGQTQQSDACSLPLPAESAAVWFTDPPYYDAIPYADLSDFFLVWLKRTLPGHPLLKDPYSADNPLSPKRQEVVQDETQIVDGRPKDRGFFEEAMAASFHRSRRVLNDGGIGCVIFAHKTTEGWEALLSGMIRGGWTITGSWPISTEMANRLRARESAALATSVHLVCRPRREDAPVGDWSVVLTELPSRVTAWMDRLQVEGVRGADLVFACIGPALEIYSRYSRVVDAEDREIPLGGDAEAVDPYQRGYLAYVWEAVGRAALNQVLGVEGAGALEEDARLVSLFLWTLQSTSGTSDLVAHDEEADDMEDQVSTDDDGEEGAKGRKPKGYTLIYDVARRFAQPLGIHLDDWERRIIETKKGVVRLLPVSERAKQLFGEDGAQAAADRIEKEPTAAQLSFFPEVEPKPRRGRRKITITASDESISQNRNTTTLDRLHMAMLLQSSGRANALRALLAAEQERGPEFLRLANALSALYPRDSEEKRLLDAMLLAVRR